VATYLPLFASAFLAATIFPFYSEFAVAGALALHADPVAVLAVATLGNTLGAALNWVLGRFLVHYQDRRWFPFRGRQVERAQCWFQRYGVWSLLMAWAPVGGDALTFIAGLMRVRFDLFFALTAIGKGGRYAVLIYLVEGVRGTAW
jgi:membrane protein YqaA with SNARE-associated domain